jgi:hypothetical protein
MSNFFFAMSQFDWPITKKKLKLWRLPKIEGSKVWSASPFAIGERRTTFVNMLLGICQELENSLL